MSESYGLPPGTAINYRALGFPAWVDELCRQWDLDSSTYPGHQEGDRPDIGAAPNPQHLNRGIDWAGDPQKMLEFAHWLRDHGPARTPGRYGPPGLEMVIFQDPRTGERVGYPPFVNYGDDYGGHTDHVHTRQSASLIDIVPPPVSRQDQYALAVLEEGRRRGITPRGIQIAFAVVFVESGWKNYANSNVPESLAIPHDAVGSDHDSVGLFQQRCPMWGPANVLMDPTASAGLFYDRLAKLDYNGGDSPGSYAQAVQRSAYPDRYDQRFGDAVALYDRLAGAPPAPIEEGFLMALSDAEQRELLELARRESGYQRVSRSAFRHLDEKPGETISGFMWNTDGSVHVMYVYLRASLGDPVELALLREVAAADPVKYPDRQRDRLLAQAMLHDIATKRAAKDAPAAVEPLPSLPPPVYNPPAVIETPRNGAEPEKSTGQVIADLYEALEALRLADALPIEARAPLSALIQVLNVKNGTNI